MTEDIEKPVDTSDWKNFSVHIEYTDTITGVVLARAKSEEAARTLLLASVPPTVNNFKITEITEVSDEDVKLMTAPPASDNVN